MDVKIILNGYGTPESVANVEWHNRLIDLINNHIKKDQAQFIRALAGHRIYFATFDFKDVGRLESGVYNIDYLCRYLSANWDIGVAIQLDSYFVMNGDKISVAAKKNSICCAITW